MHKFDESYVIKLVIALHSGHSIEHAVETIDECYQEGNIAGSFRMEQIGALVVVTFVREIWEDAEVLNGKTEAEPMTPANVANQLYRELRKAAPDTRGSQHYVQQAMNALEGGQYSVEGLPCQYPALTVTMVAYFENHQLEIAAKERLELLLKTAAFQVNGRLAVVRIESGGAEEIAANA